MLFLTVALAAPLLAQPQPNFSMRRDARLWLGTWPADFNRDGRTDLIAGARPANFDPAGDPPNLLVLLGRGDGTFSDPRTISIPARPVATGHFNGDGNIDVVLYRRGEVSVLPGNGNGTFGTRRVVSTTAIAHLPFAIVADFNADGHRDLVVSDDELPSGDTGMLLFPGNGDFTFDPPVQFSVPYYVNSGISGDFNKDGRRDLAITALCCSAFVYLNRGGLLFDRIEIPLNYDLSDITTADLNRDGNADLLVAATFPYLVQYGLPGRVVVIAGNGDGTFHAPVYYDTGVEGEGTIVAGDFNRDGLIDVATGNWSAYYDDDGFGYQLWDSISIMRGDGSGRLLRGTTYALGRVNQGAPNYTATHNMLNTSDLNGDGRTDLIASPGAIMLNRAPALNRAPSASAGPDLTIPPGHDDGFNLLGAGSDPDAHWLTYTWRDQSGVVIGSVPFIHYNQPAGTARTYTLTVSDGFGGTAQDSATVTREPDPEQ